MFTTVSDVPGTTTTETGVEEGRRRTTEVGMFGGTIKVL